MTWPWGFFDVNLAGLGDTLQGLSAWADAGVQGSWTTSAVWDSGLTYGFELNTLIHIGQMQFPLFAGVAAQAQPQKGGFLNPQFYLGFSASSNLSGLLPQAKH